MALHSPEAQLFHKLFLQILDHQSLCPKLHCFLLHRIPIFLLSNVCQAAHDLIIFLCDSYQSSSVSETHSERIFTEKPLENAARVQIAYASRSGVEVRLACRPKLTTIGLHIIKEKFRTFVGSYTKKRLLTRQIFPLAMMYKGPNLVVCATGLRALGTQSCKWCGRISNIQQVIEDIMLWKKSGGS